MEAITQIIISFLGIVGIGGIITALVNKSKEIEFNKLEQKQKRYKCTLIFMHAYFEPQNLKPLSMRHPDINNLEDLKQALKSEYHEMLLYASKGVIFAVKKFIEEPNKEFFLASVLAMRKDLWTKKSDFDIEEVSLEENVRIDVII